MREEYGEAFRRREERKEKYLSRKIVSEGEYYLSKTALVLSVPAAIAGLGYIKYYKYFDASPEYFLVASITTVVGIGGIIWGASTRLEDKV
ncbi:MAG: hypothetical protein ISS01_02260 [Nanoarchaeota archaeon]|nr:hypothetical protein [Nanoarchaeota archaeon]